MNNEPAFPSKNINCNGQYDQQFKGISTRDYFAAKAMQGFISCRVYSESIEKFNYTTEENDSRLSESCYRIADAMLKAREL